MRLFLLLSLPLLVLDIASKEWILAIFPDPPPVQPIVVVPDFFHLTRVHNTGVAFGMGNGTGWSNLVFGAIAVGAFVLVAWFWKRGLFPHWSGRLAAALLLAGIPGNLLDRIRHGYVVDFLDFHWNGRHWPAFNVADSCITVAAVLLFVNAFLPEPSKAEATPGREEDEGAEHARRKDKTAQEGHRTDRA